MFMHGTSKLPFVKNMHRLTAVTVSVVLDCHNNNKLLQ